MMIQKLHLPRRTLLRGLGATIGSVIPTDGAVIPAAVGVDIGCGMCAVETSLTAADLPDSLQGYLDRVATAIPAGTGKGHGELTAAAAAWLAANPAKSALAEGKLKKIGRAHV